MGKRQRFRSGDLDPMTGAIDALVRAVEPELRGPGSAQAGTRSLPMVPPQVPDARSQDGAPAPRRG